MILDKIVQHKRTELARVKQTVPLAHLVGSARSATPVRSFAAALAAPGLSLIAEIKKASPSKGPIRLDLDVMDTARAYESAGAAAISVLTESRFFAGRIDDLAAVRQAVALPVLRKDFIFDPYQVYEARAAGADALLLIVAILDDGTLRSLLALTRSLGMEALVETHDHDEMRRAIAAGARVIGINNRDLRTFQVDIATTTRLSRLVPPGGLVVSESGIATADDVHAVRTAPADAVLVGEALVCDADPRAAVGRLVAAGQDWLHYRSVRLLPRNPSGLVIREGDADAAINLPSAHVPDGEPLGTAAGRLAEELTGLPEAQLHLLFLADVVHSRRKLVERAAVFAQGACIHVSVPEGTTTDSVALSGAFDCDPLAGPIEQHLRGDGSGEAYYHLVREA